jgi:hypothetical protein
MPAGLGYRAKLLSGDAGTAQTIALMRKLIDRDLASSSFIRFAHDLVRNVPAHDEWSEAETVYNWVAEHIRFTKDPLTKETLFPPSELIKSRSGDCDDIAMLLGALYMALGYPARLVTVAANTQSPDEFTHFYTELELPPGSNIWVAAYAARPGSQFGIHPPEYYRRRAWSLADDSYQDLSGATRLRGLGYIRYRTLGQDSGINWSQILTQGISEIPQTIAAVQGQPTSARIGTSLVSTGPYSSFVTPYTPGAYIPSAGYPNPSVSLSATSNWIWPLLLIGGAIVLLKR